MDKLVLKAQAFATRKHGEIGHKRKYTGEDYIVHPEEVASIVASLPDSTSEMVAAAWLHDTVEDTYTFLLEIEEEFGYIVARYVCGLTDISKPEDGNRKARKAKDRAWLAEQCKEVQTIKMADIISNSTSILERDSKFAKVYLQEIGELYKVLTDADTTLRERVKEILERDNL